jgi:hypothetical protein
MLGATSVVVFLVTALTLNLNDASVHVTHASTPAPRLSLPAPTQDAAPPASQPPAFGPAPAVAKRVEPRRAEPKPDAEPVSPQMTASNAPIADPSTFGSEAYEVVYSN